MSLANKCMDFCQALASQGTSFSFTLTTGSRFSFSLDTRGMKTVQAKKKKLSPSDVRRNERRRQEFLRRKPAAVSTSPTTTSSTSPAAVSVASEVPQVPSRTCKRCNLPCQGHPAPGYGMSRCQVNLDASGQSAFAPTTPETLRGPRGIKSALTSSPFLPFNREESCANCEGAFSPTHQCEDESSDGDDGGARDGDEAGEGLCTCDCPLPVCCVCLHDPKCTCYKDNPESICICSCEAH